MNGSPLLCFLWGSHKSQLSQQVFASGRNSQKNGKHLQIDPRLGSLAGPHSVVSIEQIVFHKISKGGKVDLWIWVDFSATDEQRISFWFVVGFCLCFIFLVFLLFLLLFLFSSSSLLLLSELQLLNIVFHSECE